jgi:hypothetical protein
MEQEKNKGEGKPSRKRKLEREGFGLNNIKDRLFCMNFELIESWWLILYDFFMMLVDIFHDFLCFFMMLVGDVPYVFLALDL